MVSRTPPQGSGGRSSLLIQAADPPPQISHHFQRRRSSPTRGAVTAVTTQSAGMHAGSSTVYTGRALSGVGFTILQMPVFVWHTYEPKSRIWAHVTKCFDRKCPPLPAEPSSQTGVDNPPCSASAPTSQAHVALCASVTNRATFNAPPPPPR